MKKNNIVYMRGKNRSSMSFTDMELKVFDFFKAKKKFKHRSEFICYILDKKDMSFGNTQAVRDYVIKMLWEMYEKSSITSNIKGFIEECLEEAKQEYFNDDHHYYPNEAAKDVEWKNIFDDDIFFEYVLEKIEKGCPDLYQLSTPHSLYVYCLEMVKGE